MKKFIWPICYPKFISYVLVSGDPIIYLLFFLLTILY